jgi:hypothetical protein
MIVVTLAKAIIMSILLHHYIELKECMTEVKQMGHQSRTFTADRLTVASASDGSKEVTLFLRRF